MARGVCSFVPLPRKFERIMQRFRQDSTRCLLRLLFLPKDLGKDLGRPGNVTPLECCR